mmetsp:Transcript_65111/g.174559  ORF Transcript_65111/g.174559 Transcript_65111/m.174559 type:complete len:82 (-) Transcript_65111:833-1078(-)
MAGRDRSRQCSVFVGNIPYDADEDQLRDIFSRFGIADASCIIYLDTLAESGLLLSFAWSTTRTTKCRRGLGSVSTGMQKQH